MHCVHNSFDTIYSVLQIALSWKSFTVANLKCNLLEKIHGWMVLLYGQSLLHRLFHWNSFTVTNQSAKLQNFSTSNDLQYTVFSYLVTTQVNPRSIRTTN